MTYYVKEMFYSLQGEGVNSGKPALFCRFSGCNLWDGKFETRNSAQTSCRFCDTDFSGTDGENGGIFDSPEELLGKALDVIRSAAIASQQLPMIVFTGGEPLLQLDEALVRKTRDRGFYIAVETNGTIAAPAGIDWLAVSPKTGCKLVQRSGNELKLVFPQPDINPDDFLKYDFENFCLQPCDNESVKQNTVICTDYCLQNPIWRLSIQTHKLLNIK
ncbi:MAG: 7-carboxy-7-deazaguanine synthase [Candidatus Riflebacteria bacterium]|nr:7-carboxy-7-deazaguanine synthase [Candidatus Riflebacteria bacterium]